MVLSDLENPAISIDITEVQCRFPGRTGGICVARNTVTVSTFNFSTLFLAQIVENRERRLSTPFFGHGDFFPKRYNENRSGWPLL
jgi:hypothetical protein